MYAYIHLIIHSPSYLAIYIHTVRIDRERYKEEVSHAETEPEEAHLPSIPKVVIPTAQLSLPVVR